MDTTEYTMGLLTFKFDRATCPFLNVIDIGALEYSSQYLKVGLLLNIDWNIVQLATADIAIS